MVLEFEKDKAYVKFTPEKEVIATTYTIKVFALNKTDGGSKKHVYTSKSYNLNKEGENSWYIVIDYWYYNAVAKKLVNSGKPLPNIIEFSFKIVLEEKEEEVPDVYEVHFVRYMPKLLNILGYKYGEKFQRIWFTNKSNTNKENVDPKIDAFDWNWIVAESDQIKGEYNEFLRDTKTELNALFNNDVKKSIRYEINKMISRNIAKLPTKKNPKTSFGSFDKKIETYKGEKMPLFEVLYFNSKEFSGALDNGLHYIFDGIDDFIAAIATTNFHLTAKGDLIYVPKSFFSNASVKIKINQFAFYIKDRFDFEDEPNEDSQHLGYWKLINKNKVQVDYIEILDKSSYFHVTNKTYRNYRNAHKKGYDFHLYSTLNIQNVDIELSL